MQVPQIKSPAPAPVVQPPAVKGPVAPPPQRSRFWWVVGGLLVAVGGAALWMQQSAKTQQATAAVAVVRTAPARSGVLENTLRLTGTTGAEKFSLILAPQLRGSRSGFGRGGPSGSFSSRGGGGGSSSVESRASNTSAGGGTSQASAGGMSAGGSLSSSAGAGGGVANSRGAAAMRASTSRLSSSSRSSSSSSSRSGASGAASSAAMGNEGLGSTSGGLSGGSGGPPSIGSSSGGGSGGRGGGEFSLILQKVAPSGSLVKKGDVVAEFDRESMLTRLNDYEASVIQSEASFQKLKADLSITKKAHDQSILAAKGEYEKAQLNLKTTPVMGAIETERIKLALEEADARYKQLLKEVQFVEAGLKADLKVAEIELEQSKIELRRAEMNANRMLMTAPIGGLVVMQNTFRGSEFDQVKQGDQLFPGQPFMQIVDTSSMVVNAVVNQLDVEKIRIGLRAKVRFDAFPDLVLPARIAGIGSVGKSSRYRPDFLKEMSVLLKLEKMDPRVIPDLSVSCDVILEATEESVIVPREAVHFEAASAAGAAGGGPESAGAYVLVQRDKDWQKRPVELGASNFVSVAIKSGVKPGEVVALERPPTQAKL